MVIWRLYFTQKENLILKNYFPILSKKAYCEDLIHSEELKKKINLYLNTEALAYYNDFEGFKSFSILIFLKVLKLIIFVDHIL